MGKWKFSIERTGYTWTLKWIGNDTIYEEKQSFLGLIGLISGTDAEYYAACLPAHVLQQYGEIRHESKNAAVSYGT